MGSFQRKRMWNRRFREVYKHQVLRSITLTKANPGAYSSYERINIACFTFMLGMIVYYVYGSCTDGDRLHGSTLPYTILV
jgi:hypothetical protein